MCTSCLWTPIKTIDKTVVQTAPEKRKELIERLAEVDDDIAELFISEIEPTRKSLHCSAASFQLIFFV